MTDKSALAASGVTPALRRASTLRWIQRGQPELSASGSQRSVSSGIWNPGAMIPTTVRLWPSSVSARPITCGSPPKRRRHSPSLRIAASREDSTIECISGDLLKRFRLISPLHISLAIGAIHLCNGAVLAKQYEPVGVPVRERPQQYRIHDAEDRRVRADAERQRERGNRSEAFVLEQHPQAKTQVLYHLVLPSFGLQTERIPERARAPPQQFNFVPPIETVPFGQQPFAVSQLRFPLLPPVGAKSSRHDHTDQRNQPETGPGAELFAKGIIRHSFNLTPAKVSDRAFCRAGSAPTTGSA